MATRGSILRRLSDIPTQDVLGMLPDDVLIALANKCFTDQVMAATQSDLNMDMTAGKTGRTETPTIINSDRLKRPLNAFMAFRSYYLKLFPDTQQKTASGFLTNLWGRDPFRNKWALIAKVYSFVRDELGKDRVTLSNFLNYACPIMNMIEPSEYLQQLGWVFQEGDKGVQTLLRDEDFTIDTEDDEGVAPNTEVELLSCLVSCGYMLSYGDLLIERMNNRNNGVLTGITTSSSSNPSGEQNSTEKSNFIEMLRNNSNYRAGEQFLSVAMREVYDDGGLNIKAQNLDGMAPFKVPVPSLRAETQRYFDSISKNESYYPHDGVTLNFDNVQQPKCYDISNPWHLDAIITEQNSLHTDSGQFSVRPGPAYNAEEDFHFAF